MLDADCFAGIDGLLPTAKYYSHIWRHRGVFSRPLQGNGKPSQAELRAMLAPDCRIQYDKYEQQLEAGHKVGYLSGALTADVSQSQEDRNRSGPFLPAMTHSTIAVSLTARPKQTQIDLGVSGGHIFTPNELRFASGWPSIEFECNQKYKACMAVNHDNLSYSASSTLLGNGIHLLPWTAWQLYIAANSIRKGSLVGFAPPRTLEAPSDELSDVDGIVES